MSTLYAVYKVNQAAAYGPFIDYYFSLDSNTNRYLRPLVKKGAKNDMKINNAYVLRDRIFAPSIPEQIQIASFFEALDKKIAQLKQKSLLLENYKIAILKKVFSKEFRFKTESGKEFPQWKKSQLGAIANKINSGKTPLGGESVYSETGVLLIRSQNVIDNKLSYENSVYIPEKINETMKNSFVRARDILLNITGASLGRSCVVPDDFKTGNVNQHVCIVRINNENNPYFIQPILASEIGQRLFNSLQAGSGREGLNFQSIKRITLSLPSLEEQTKIANFIGTLDAKIDIVRGQITKIDQYKKGLLQKMFI